MSPLAINTNREYTCRKASNPGGQPSRPAKRDARMADYDQISFRVDPDLKRQFELALVYRSVRQKRKATAVGVLTQKIEEFIAEEEKAREAAP